MTTSRHKKVKLSDEFMTNHNILFDKGLDLKSRKIRITGEINEHSFDHFDSCLTELENISSEPIRVIISSPGGNPYSALSIVGRLRTSKCQIITEGYGHIMSAAVMILACGDERSISKYAWFMAHKASYSLEGPHDTIMSEVKSMEQQEIVWAQWMSEFSSKTSEFWLSAVKQKNFYITAEQCLEYGIVDKII